MRFEVTVDDAVIVSMLHRLRRQANQSRGLARREWSFLHEPLQRAPGDEAHREKVLAVNLSDFIDGDDVGMVERGGSAGFSLKAFDGVARAQLTRQNHL